MTDPMVPIDRANAAESAALEAVRAELALAADPVRAVALARYFQTGPGGYGEGDQMLGVPVPAQRRVAAHHWQGLGLDDAAVLLRSGWHEERLTAIFILIRKYNRATGDERGAIVELTLASTALINNWDLVDASAPYLLGRELLDRELPSREPLSREPLGGDSEVLDRLASSGSVWERRTAIMATLAFIRAGRFDRTLVLAERLVHDEHDLIHKAVGWMLREVGNRDRAVEEEFLAGHHRTMPRTMLRYAIEKFPPELRTAYLTGRPTPA